jgi:hypothetical protein
MSVSTFSCKQMLLIARKKLSEKEHMKLLDQSHKNNEQIDIFPLSLSLRDHQLR